MTPKLPEIVQRYVTASNAHDVASILDCFAEDAVVHDEGELLRGKKAVENWIGKTIEKYHFQFKPLNVKEEGGEVIVNTEVSGTFNGSPVNLDFHFGLKGEKIASLHID